MSLRTFTWESKYSEDDSKERVNVTLCVTNEKLEPLVQEILKSRKIVTISEVWNDYCNHEDISYFVTLVIEKDDKEVVFGKLKRVGFREV